MASCAAEKGVSFCSECDQYPCGELKEFQSQAPHRLELWESLDMAKDEGLEAWFDAMHSRYACPGCGAVNSAYDAACRKCGAAPSCSYVETHGEQIAQSVSRLSR
jgi:hypothetical protein